MTSTHIGTWAMDKLIRFSILPRGGEPVLWDFGSAAKHHTVQNTWLDRAHAEASASGREPHHNAKPILGSRAGISTLRGAISPAAGQAEGVADKIYEILKIYGLENAPLGVDIIEPPVLFALQKKGITVVDGQQVFLEARRIKTKDEITLLTSAASMVDAAYDRLYEFLRPGVRENEAVGLVANSLYSMGSEHVEGVNAISQF
jgi:Xaa-Pro aminopeptidase